MRILITSIVERRISLKKRLLYALLFALVTFVAQSLKYITFYQTVYGQSINNFVLDIVISTIYGFVIGLFFTWCLDLEKNAKLKNFNKKK